MKTPARLLVNLTKGRSLNKTESPQVNKVLTQVLCHNLCMVIQSMYEWRVEPQFRVEAP